MICRGRPVAPAGRVAVNIRSGTEWLKRNPDRDACRIADETEKSKRIEIAKPATTPT